MQCSGCGASWPEGSKFCGDCGAALPQGCPACGHTNPVAAKFCLSCGASLQLGSGQVKGPTKASEPIAVRPRTVPATNQAERRQIAVMFCDMVGSSALSTRLDPEEQREVVSAFQSC